MHALFERANEEIPFEESGRLLKNAHLSRASRDFPREQALRRLSRRLNKPAENKVKRIK